MRINVAKLVGLPGGGAWSQIHTFLPPEEEKQGSHGELIAAIALRNISGGMAAIELGREVLSRLHEEYFGKESDSPLRGLSDAVSRVNLEFRSLEPELVCLVLWKNYAYFCLAGAGQVLLYRRGRLSRLLRGAPPLAGGEEPVLLSGEVKEGDIFLLATEGFSSIVGEGLLLGAFAKNLSPQELADELAPFIHKAAGSTTAAAIVKIEEIELSTGEAGEDLPAQAGKEKVPTPNIGQRLRIPLLLPRIPKIMGIRQLAEANKWLTGIASRLPQKSFYVKRDPGSSRRTAVSAGIILIALLLVAIVFGLRQKGTRQYQSTYSDRLARAESLYQDSLLQKDINQLLAKESFREAQGIVQELVSEGIKDKKIEELKQSIERDRIAILGIVEVKPTVFLDLSLIRSGVQAQELAFDEGVLVILDKGGGRIMSVSVESKETKVIAGQEKVGNSRSVSVYSGRYFSASEKGVVELDKQGVGKVIIQPDSETGEIWRIAVFGGNVYLFAKSGEIWRYPVTEGGFGTKQRWLGKGIAPESAQGQDVAIDGSIWVLSGTGKLAEFTRGSPEAFQVKGLDGSFQNPQALYTDEDLEDIFVLDGGGRIVVLGKNGEYLRQYLLGEMGGMGEIRDIAVSKKAGKIFLLTETKILEIPLK